MWEWVVIIFLVLLVIYYVRFGGQEGLTDGIKPDVQSTPYIRLYSSFGERDLVFEHVPAMDYPNYKYLNTFYRGTVKSMDINLPKQDDNLDIVRTIEIWGVNGSDNLASSECDFYNPFTEPSWAKRANYPKYKLLAKIGVNDRVKMDVPEPIKKVFIYARM